MYESKLVDIVILLALSVAILVVFRRLNISAVLGYMCVGLLIGDHGLNVIKDVDSTRHFAEYGVVFLLFLIGLELTFERLKEMRLHVFGFGTLQVIFCALVITMLCYLITGEQKLSFVIGFILALSSTAIVVQVLEDRGEQATQHGRLSLAALILQDLAFVPLLIAIPLIAKGGEQNFFLAIGEAFLHATIALVLIVIIGKKFLGPVYRMIATLKSQELFLATTLVILLGTAWITQHYGLSLALGAFVAGLLVAETEFRNQVETDLKPFKGLLMGLFFISVGMTLNLNILRDNIQLIVTLTITILFCKSVIIYALARAFGFRRSCSIKTGMLLSQSSEFAFVLLALAATLGLLEGDLKQVFVVTVALSMAITPMLAVLAEEISKRVDVKNPLHLNDKEIKKEVSDLENHIIVIGFNKVGRTTCDLLNYKELNYVAIDDDPTSVHQGIKKGYPVFYGKCDQIENIEHLGLERAKMVVLTKSDARENTALVKLIREKHPQINIIARARDRIHSRELRHVGADFTIAERFESSLMISNFILSSIGLSSSEIEDAISRFRAKEHPESQIRGISYHVKDVDLRL